MGILDPGMEPQNPVNSYGDGRMLLGECASALAGDPGVAVVALATNLVHGRPYARASSTAMEATAAGTTKPAILFGNIHSSVSREEASRLRALGIPVLMGTATALAAMRNLLQWHHGRSAAPEAKPSMPGGAALDEARSLAKSFTAANAISIAHASPSPMSTTPTS